MSKTKYAGIARSSTSITGEALTEAKMQKFIDYFSSKEYEEREQNRQKMRAGGEIIAQLALNQGIINEREYLDLIIKIGINGMLIVSPKMGERLNKVNIPKRYNKFFKSHETT